MKIVDIVTDVKKIYIDVDDAWAFYNILAKSTEIDKNYFEEFISDVIVDDDFPSFGKYFYKFLIDIIERDDDIFDYTPEQFKMMKENPQATIEALTNKAMEIHQLDKSLLSVLGMDEDINGVYLFGNDKNDIISYLNQYNDINIAYENSTLTVVMDTQSQTLSIKAMSVEDILEDYYITDLGNIWFTLYLIVYGMTQVEYFGDRDNPGLNEIEEFI